jgi:hypothetical protein
MGALMPSTLETPSLSNGRVAPFGWTVLALVFLDELLAMAGLGVYGWSTSVPWLLVWLLPLLAMLSWFLFASPKARFGSGVVRPVVKVLVFGLASWGLWAAGHHSLAVALLAFSVVVNGLAQLPAIRALAAESGGSAPGR